MRDRWFVRRDSEYVVHGNSFHIKDELKAAGGRWDSAVKVWRLKATKNSLDTLRALRVAMWVKVLRAAYCHTPEESGYADSADADRGFETRGFCTRCDSQHGPPIAIRRTDPAEDTQFVVEAARVD